MVNIVKIFAKIRRPTLRQGLMWGLLLGVVEIIYGYGASFIASADIQNILSAIGLALFVLFGFIAGQRAARETGRLGTAAIAGIWVGLFGSVLAALVQLVNWLVNLSNIVAGQQQAVLSHPSQYPGVKPSDITPSSVLTVLVIDLLLNIAFYILLALLGGIFGGLLGRRRGPVTAPDADGETYEEAMFKPPVSDGTVQ
ncbi:MAG TPA: hypothetical protein VKV19_03105 [Ktedonobacteraceae bacterium]|jgi:hypothetical protein|nr:hypothetical protein [Ktedonobacteraceae bacterium]